MNKVPPLPDDLANRLRVLNVLERLSQINLARNDMEEGLRDILELILDVFNADRAWFLYPCNPDAQFWNVPMECTRPDWPGLFSRDVDMPMDSVMSNIYSELLRADGPVQYGAGTDHPVPQPVVENFSVKSQLMTAMQPKIGDCWVFGLHHCEREVVHDKHDLQLFTAIAQRISDFLSLWISVRKLRESEERWKFALEGSGYGMWDWDPQSDEATFSKRWKEILGYNENEFPDNGTAWVEHLHPDDRDRILAILQEYLAGKQPVYSGEFRMRCKDGSYKWILTRGKRTGRGADGKPLGIVGTHNDAQRIIGIHADITMRKQAETERTHLMNRLESLNEQLLTAQEDERRSIAFELHEQLGQELTTLRLHLQMLKEQVDSAASGTHLDAALMLAGRALGRARKMSMDLAAPLPEDCGLNTALRRHCLQQAAATGWVMKIDVPEHEVSPLPEVAKACFRVTQEALTNVMRHAHAKTVWVSLRQSAHKLTLIVRDDGIGFDSTAVLGSEKWNGLGCFGMLQRTRNAGGNLEIHSTPGAGTTVSAIFPQA